MKKVLVIDDYTDILELVTSVLKRRGFNIHTYPTGENVKEIIFSYEPDLVLLDIHLPGKQVYTFVKTLKQ